MTAARLPAFGAQAAPADPHGLARSILSEPRFRVRVAAGKTWWDAFLSWLGDRWNQVADAFARHVHLGVKETVAAGDVVLAAAILAVLFVAFRLLRSYVRESRTQSRAAPIVPRVAAGDLYAQSVRAADRGDYAAAVALVFRAGLTGLDLRGAVRDEPSRTVNECRREIRERAPRFARPFDALARTFTAVVYAGAPATREQWSAACAAYADLFAGTGDAA